MADATTTGSTTMDKSVKASLSQSEIESGTVLDTSTNVNKGGYYYIGVAKASYYSQSGDSGGAVFSSDGSELLGFTVAKTLQNDAFYVKHDKVTTWFSGLTWDF